MIGAQEAVAPSSLADLRVFIRVVLAVIVTVTHPALWYTVTCVTLEAAGLTCMVAHCAVGLIRPVSAVVVSVAAPRLANTNASSTCELSWATLVRLTVLLVTIVSTVVFMVTFEGQRDAGARGHAAKLVGRVAGGGGTLLLITHVTTVVVAVTLPDAADAAAVGAAVLVGQAAVLTLDAGVVLELVAHGTLALQLSVGHGYGRGAVWADAGVSVAGLR